MIKRITLFRRKLHLKKNYFAIYHVIISFTSCDRLRKDYLHHIDIFLNLNNTR